MKRGEIYYIEYFYQEVGSEQKAGRPAVIVSNNNNNNNSEVVEVCYLTTKPKNDLPTHVVTRGTGIASTVLYECGLKRVGCVGCSMAGSAGMKKEFIRWPKFRTMYVHAFDRMVQERLCRGLPTKWKDGEEVMTWWLGDDPDQIQLDYITEE